jgi:hypothetical protein
MAAAGKADIVKLPKPASLAYRLRVCDGSGIIAFLAILMREFGQVFS